MIAVVETEEFLADVKGVLSEDEHEALIWYVAQYPEAGVLIPETGGLRKLRWTAKGKGKRGGSRVIYYFHNLDVPVFLMAIFATTSRPICRRDSVSLWPDSFARSNRIGKRKGPNESSRPTESAEGISLGRKVAAQRPAGARLGRG
jgi:hypothetical protein